jgi:thiamine biosynthesis protein ThiC
MDLSTGGDIPTIRKAIIQASPVPIVTVLRLLQRQHAICR